MYLVYPFLFKFRRKCGFKSIRSQYPQVPPAYDDIFNSSGNQEDDNVVDHVLQDQKRVDRSWAIRSLAALVAFMLVLVSVIAAVFAGGSRTSQPQKQPLEGRNHLFNFNHEK